MTSPKGIAAGALVALVVAGSPALPCGCYCLDPPTIRQQAAQAKVVLYAKLVNTGATADDGVTELHIVKALKSAPALGDKKVVKLSRHVRVDPQEPNFIVFADIIKGDLDPYRGIPVKSATVAEYVQKILALDGRDRTKALVFFFDYLDHEDAEIAGDAFLEFTKSTAQEIGQVAAKLPADRLRRWLQDPRTPAVRVKLYGFLLGGCGGDQDAALLRSLLVKPNERLTPAFEGLLRGYIQLRPREGWKLAVALMANQHRPFAERYAALKAARVVWDWRPSVVSRPTLAACVCALLDQGDIADLAIDDLRKWGRWEVCDQVLGLYGRKSHDLRIIHLAILRYAMCCPQGKAAEFVREFRKRDPDTVEDMGELLMLETEKS